METHVLGCVFDTMTDATGSPQHVYIRSRTHVLKQKLNGRKIREWSVSNDTSTGGACFDSARELIVSASGQSVSRTTRLGRDPGYLCTSSVKVRKAKVISSVAYHAQSDRYIITDTELKSVMVVDATSGKVKSHVKTSRGNWGDDLDFPDTVSCHRMSPHGLIAVTDSANHCVKLYNIKAKLLRFLGSYGDGRCQLNSPRGVCMDAMGRIVVCDHGNKRVVRFTRMCVGGSWRWECILSPEMLAHRHPSYVDISNDGHMVVILTTADDACHSWALFKGYH